MVLDANSAGLKYEIEDEVRQSPRIKVLGVGGGGSNAVAHMMSSGLEGVEFYVLNTDLQALKASPVVNKISIGSKLTNGQGAGADPTIGRQAALDDTERIVEALEGADIVFVTAGLGAGTGTGATPVVASLAKELNALTVAIVTKPFDFEGPVRARQAAQGLQELAGAVDTVISVPNDRLLALAPRGTSLLEGFRMANDILRQAVQEIVEIITTPGLINRDFSDIRSTMRGMGYAVMGVAQAKGENAAVEAVRQAIACPLVEDGTLSGARNILVQVTGSSSLGLHDVSDACAFVRQATQCEDVQLSFGVVLNEEMADAVKVTLIATGFDQERPEATEQPTSPAPATPEWFSEPPPPRVEFESAEPQPQPQPEPEPEFVQAYQDEYATYSGSPQQSEFDLEEEDDLETPAYLRHQRLVP